MDISWIRSILSGRNKPSVADAHAHADSDGAAAQFGLALRYATGAEGQAPDYPEAARWYRKAADQNHALAQCNLATMYAQGQGVDQSSTEADAWYEKAARQGDPGAQFNLGIRCRRESLERRTSGSNESRIEAYKWLHLAAAQGYQGASAACEEVNLQLNRADVLEGNRRAAAILEPLLITAPHS